MIEIEFDLYVFLNIYSRIVFQFSCKDYYEVLKVTKEATDTEIKKSYKKLALVLHPGIYKVSSTFCIHVYLNFHHNCR